MLFLFLSLECVSDNARLRNIYRYKEPIGSGDNKYFRAVPELPSNDVNRLPTIPGQ